MDYNPLNPNMWWICQGKRYEIPEDYFCLKTDDLGQTWEEINNYSPTYDYPQPSYTIAVNSKNPNILYIGDNDAMGPNAPPSPIHIWKSTDFGESWFALENALPYIKHDVYDLAVDPIHPDTLYVSAYYGVYKSYNGGNTFQRLNLDVENNWITVDPEDPSLFHVACWNLQHTGETYLSVDGGRKFFLNDENRRLWTSSMTELTPKHFMLALMGATVSVTIPRPSTNI